MKKIVLKSAINYEAYYSNTVEINTGKEHKKRGFL
jgi:hypothetical protein